MKNDEEKVEELIKTKRRQSENLNNEHKKVR